MLSEEESDDSSVEVEPDDDSGEEENVDSDEGIHNLPADVLASHVNEIREAAADDDSGDEDNDDLPVGEGDGTA